MILWLSNVGFGGGGVAVEETDSTLGGSTGSTDDTEESRQREYNRREKERREKIQAVKPKRQKKKTYKLDNKEIQLTPEDTEWVKAVVDKPWTPTVNETFLRQIEARRLHQIDLDNRDLEKALQTHLEFMQDEEEAISLILITMI